MSIRRIFSFLAIVGLIAIIATKGFHFSIENKVTTVFLNPWTLPSWLLLLVALVASLQEKPQSSETIAAWWRGAVAFLVDVPLIICFFAIPFCLFVLVIENGGIPSTWLIERRSGTSSDTLYSILFIPVFAATWSGIGFCLHPKISTPGALVANATIEIKEDLPRWRLAFFGPFAYYGVFIPFFKYFAPGIEVEKRVRAA